jgi:hypothetical protein
MAFKINKSQWTQIKASGERMSNLNSKSNTTYNQNPLGSVAF